MSITKGKIAVKHLAPLRAPRAVMQAIETELRNHRMAVGPFILSSLMVRLGYPKEDVRRAVTLAYPRRWQEGGEEE